MDKLLKDLNDKQKLAVTAPLGPVLVLAGAGSGKTRALTYRIAYLIAKKLFKPEDILALTFTNKAAGEMRERILKLLPTTYHLQANITMGTFHSVCLRILRQEVEKLGFGYNRNFTIYDEDDKLRLLKQIVLELGLSENYRPQLFAYYISQAKNRLSSIRNLDLDNSTLQTALEEVAEIYEARMREHNALDFDDLLTYVCELFSPSPRPSHQGRGIKSKFPPLDSRRYVGVEGEGKGGMLKKYQEKFKYILVDEYQDTNHVQYMILKLLAAEHHNLFVVGDDAQSIYGFRGANMQNILDFKKDYPKARVIMLEQNYRSNRPILDVANKVIGLNRGQYEKKLWTENLKGPKVSLYEAQDEGDEARFVLHRIISPSPSPSPQGRGNSSPLTRDVTSELRGEDKGGGELVYESEETPIFNSFMDKLKARRFFERPRVYSSQIPDNLNEIVILYRTHAQSRPFEEAMLSSGVPYQIIGGIKFYERREIKDAIAYLRLFSNPRDLVSMQRIINIPARGIGTATFKLIKEALQKYDYNFGRLLNNLGQLELPDKAQAGAKEFFGLYSVLENNPLNPPYSKGEVPPLKIRGDRGVMNILDLMKYMLIRSGYKQELLLDRETGETRWENIEELFNVAARFRHVALRDAITAFLEEVALMSDLDSLEGEGNKLTMMTLHSAKGLEYDKVFLVGLEEGLLPHSRSLSNPAEIAEEVRLAYVGITRARENLYLSYARQRSVYGELRRSLPSRIIKAIPKSLINRLNDK